MSQEKPKFTIRKRGEKFALYVNNYNIWDLTEKECTKSVLEAVMHAYFLGVRDMRLELNSIDIPGDLQCEFKRI